MKNPLNFYFLNTNTVFDRSQQERVLASFPELAGKFESPDTLELVMFNNSDQNEIVLTTESQIVISFDSQGPATLHSDIAKIKAISITPGQSDVFTVTPSDSQDGNPQWIISVNKNTIITRNQMILFDIANILADRSGLTNCYISYKNVQNLEDNSVILEINRSQFIINPETGQLGIGIPNPVGNIEIVGSTTVHGNFIVNGLGSTSSLFMKGSEDSLGTILYSDDTGFQFNKDVLVKSGSNEVNVVSSINSINEKLNELTKVDIISEISKINEILTRNNIE